MKKIILFIVVLASFCDLKAQNVKPKYSTIPHNPNLVQTLKPLASHQHQVGLPLASNSLTDVLSNFHGVKAAVPGMEQFNIMKDRDGRIVMIKGTIKEMPQGSQSENIIFYLNKIKAYLNIQNIENELRIVKVEQDELGEYHAKIEQSYKGIPVYGGEILMHTEKGKWAILNGFWYPTSNIDEFATVYTTDDIIDMTHADLRAKGIEVRTLSDAEKPLTLQVAPEMVIYHKDQKAENARIAWHITTYANVMDRYEYFMDLQTGEVLESYKNSCNFHADMDEKAHAALHTSTLETPAIPSFLPPLDGPATATATDGLGVSRILNTYKVGTTFYLIDASRPMFNLGKSTLPDDPAGAVWTLDAFNTSPESSAFKYDHVKSSSNTWSDTKAVSAHYNGAQCYEYYRTTHSRNSIDGAGGTVVSIVNVSEKNGAGMDNAFWNGEAMFYGSGDKAFKPLARALDVAGHEISHGVVQATANLEYKGESGALNESFADVFGAMIDRDDWKMGEDVAKTNYFPTGCLRDLSNPNNGGASLNDSGWQPKHVSEQYKGTQDNGGVHINSGITNFAYYKFATAITKDKAEKVYYRALTKYLVKSSKFIDARAAVVQAATDLYGANSNEVKEANNAFTAVGIGSGGSSTGGNYQNDVPTNPGTDYIVWADLKQTKLGLSGATGTDLANPFSSKPPRSKPSVTDDGTFIVFVGKDKKIHSIDINWKKTPASYVEDILSDEPIWRNAVISKDGNRVAAVTDAVDNHLYVYDYTLAKWSDFTLYNPSYSTSKTNDVQYADALEFDFGGEYVVYDAFNKLSGAGKGYEYWDIGIMNVYNKKTKSFATGEIENLFSDLPKNVSVGNPTFAKNSPYIIGLDYIDDNTNKIYVTSINLETGDVGFLYDNGANISSPSFSRKDDKILFQGADSFGDYIATIDLAANKISAKSPNGFKIIKDNVKFPVWFSTGSRSLSGTSDATLTSGISVFPNPTEGFLTIELKDYSGVPVKIEVIDILGRVLLKEILETKTTNLDLKTLESGTYFIKTPSGIEKIMKF